mmetsp:Transcript_51435/g.164475  ORF Transcript_51435/g.164475 Transcript_51435/m.164475 type:complete len:115 (-) Transcript_51435:53-397(-)
MRRPQHGQGASRTVTLTRNATVDVGGSSLFTPDLRVAWSLRPEWAWQPQGSSFVSHRDLPTGTPLLGWWGVEYRSAPASAASAPLSAHDNRTAGCGAPSTLRMPWSEPASRPVT